MTEPGSGNVKANWVKAPSEDSAQPWPGNQSGETQLASLPLSNGTDGCWLVWSSADWDEHPHYPHKHTMRECGYLTRLWHVVEQTPWSRQRMDVGMKVAGCRPKRGPSSPHRKGQKTSSREDQEGMYPSKQKGEEKTATVQATPRM